MMADAFDPLDFNNAPTQASEQKKPITLALAYAERGWPVFPCNPLTKQPLVGRDKDEHGRDIPLSGGLKKATTDAFQIRAWWAKHPNAMVGVPTGPRSGFWVFDIDTDRAKGKDGVGSLAAMGHDLSELMDTVVATTASGGYHVYFRWDETQPVGNARGALKAHLDVRGDGGYIIAAGSTRADGNRYAWLNPPEENEFADAPDWLLETISSAKPAGSEPTSEFDFNAAPKREGREIDDLVRGIVSGDTYHDNLISLSSKLAAAHTVPGAAVGILRGLMEAVPPEHRDLRWRERYDDIPRAVSTAEAKFGAPAREAEIAAAEAAIKPLTAIPYDGEVPPPRPWAFGNLLLHRTVTAMAAPPGTGKSTFTIQLGIAFALSQAFGPYAPRRTGPVWIWNNEDDRDELNRRTLAACYGMGVDPRQLPGRLYLNTGAERALIVAREDKRSGLLIATPDVDGVVAEIKAKGIKLLVVDPFAETYAASEIDNDVMKEVTGLYRRIARDGDCSVFLVHHTPKSASSDTMAGSLEAFRGGGSIGGVVRIAVTLFGMSEKDAERAGITAEERHLYVRLDDAKANMSLKSGHPTWWRKHTVLIDNAEGDDPEDAVGVLKPWTFEAASKRAGKQAEGEFSRLCEEIVRVCLNNGCLDPTTAIAVESLSTALDPIKTGIKATKARQVIIGRIAPAVDGQAFRIIVTASSRGKLTTRKVHIEALVEPDEPTRLTRTGGSE